MSDQAVCFAGKILWALIWLMIGGIIVIMFAPLALVLNQKYGKEKYDGKVRVETTEI